MFIFIDITQQVKNFKQVTGVCKNCQRQKELVILKTYHCLRIFFIPIWHWGEQYDVIDESCGARYEISEEDAILVKYDKKDIGSCQLQEERFITGNCRGCGKKLDTGYDFCPHCGQGRRQGENNGV